MYVLLENTGCDSQTEYGLQLETQNNNGIVPVDCCITVLYLTKSNKSLLYLFLQERTLNGSLFEVELAGWCTAPV